MSDILHYYLDLLRGENDDRFGLHNVLSVMKQSRNSNILNECFDGIDLRNEPLADIHFSDEDGKNASSFRSCKVSRSCFLSGHSAPVESMEFIDDNTLVSKSANEVITWDVFSGVPIKTEIINYKASYDENLRMLYKAISSNSGRSLNDNEKKTKHIKIRISKKKWPKEEFIPVYSLIKNRLVVLKTLHNSPKHTIICDLKTKQAFPCYTSPNEILQVGSRFVFFDDKRLWVYDYECEKTTPTPLDILLPQSEQDQRAFSNTCVSLAHIENSDCISIDISYRSPNKTEEKYYITNINNMKTILESKDKFFTPVYIPELDGIFVLYPDRAELRSVLNEEPIIVFPKTYEYRKIIISNLLIRNAVSKNKEYIAVTNFDTAIQILSLKKGTLEKVLGGNTSSYYSTLSSDRKYAVFHSTLYSKHNHFLWNISGNTFIRYIDNRSYSSDCSFSKGNNYIVFHEDEARYTELIDLNSNESIHISLDYDKNHFTGKIAWDYSSDFLFWETGSNLFVYNNGEIFISFNWRELLNNDYHLLRVPKIADNNAYIALYASPFQIGGITGDKRNMIAVIKLQTFHTITMNHDCLSILHVSDDGRYVTVVSDADFTKAIIKTEVLDMCEQIVCSEKTIENDYLLLNYLRQHVSDFKEKQIISGWTVGFPSSGWTIKVPSSPDNSTEALIYLVPNLYIGGCDFRGSTFDDETKEIIRQYNGIV